MATWQKLKFIPDKYYGNPTKINKKEFLVPFFNSITTYDTKQNEWKEIMKYPTSLIHYDVEKFVYAMNIQKYYILFQNM